MMSRSEQFVYSQCIDFGLFCFFQKRRWYHIVNPTFHPLAATALQEQLLLKDPPDLEKVKSCEEVTNAMPVTFSMQAMWDQTVKDSLLVNYVSLSLATVEIPKQKKKKKRQIMNHCEERINCSVMTRLNFNLIAFCSIFPASSEVHILFHLYQFRSKSHQDYLLITSLNV